MEKKGKFILMSVAEFDQWLSENRFNRIIRLIQNHHTYSPSYKDFTGDNHFRLLEGMEHFHKVERGFNEIAQNLTIFPDGKIALCRPLDTIPAGIRGANQAGICIENVGNFDKDADVMTDHQREAIIKTNALLCRELLLTPSAETIVYHHWYDLDTGKRTDGTGTTKSCPGTAFFGGNTVEAAEAGFIPLIMEALSALKAKEPGETSFVTAEVTASTLNVRSGPGRSFPIVKTLSEGISVPVCEESDGWFRIHPSEQHWVSGRYLRFI
ncbi:MAG: SH3 domain-containing protein [Nitrospirales bacterium]|nr:SH3 domain-containing protein [Nitrospirales bacterium]